jgi:hypothetical protein
VIQSMLTVLLNVLGLAWPEPPTIGHGGASGVTSLTIGTNYAVGPMTLQLLSPDESRCHIVPSPCAWRGPQGQCGATYANIQWECE